MIAEARSQSDPLAGDRVAESDLAPPSVIDGRADCTCDKGSEGVVENCTCRHHGRTLAMPSFTAALAAA